MEEARVKIVGIDIPFWDMVWLMVVGVIAAIPAVIIVVGAGAFIIGGAGLLGMIVPGF